MSKLKNLENIAIKTFNSLKRSATTLTFLSLFGISSTYLKAQDWHTEIIDEEGDGPTSIVLDSQNRPHIVYIYREPENKFLKYAFLSDHGWEKTLIEETGDLGTYGGKPDIDLDNNDRPHIVYYNSNDNSIREVFLSSLSTWTTSLIDSIVISDIDLYAYPKIKIDSDDNKHVSYIDTSNNFDPTLKYASYDNGWEIEIVDHLGIWSANKNDLTLDSNDNPHVVYYYQGDPYQGIGYATMTNSEWLVLPFISGGVSQIADISIACDVNNTPYVAHHSDPSDGNNLICSYLEQPGSWPGWVVDSGIDTTRIAFAYYSSIAINDYNQPSIAYNGGWTQEEQLDFLKYASRDGQRWNIKVVDPIAGQYPSLAIFNNQPHISYTYHKYTPEEGLDSDLRYATTAPTGIKDNTTTAIPKTFYLSQNYPNPFNPNTTISYSIPEEDKNASVSLKIYDVRGRLIRNLEDTIRESGSYSITWNGRDDKNNKVSSGYYLYTLETDNKKETKKMLLLK